MWTGKKDDKYIYAIEQLIFFFSQDSVYGNRRFTTSFDTSHLETISILLKLRYVIKNISKIFRVVSENLNIKYFHIVQKIYFESMLNNFRTFLQYG